MEGVDQRVQHRVLKLADALRDLGVDVLRGTLYRAHVLEGFSMLVSSA